MANERILVVDDQPMVIEVCAAILAEAGYQVRQACGGREALACLEAERFDLLIVDLRMPEVDGLTVLRRAQGLDPEVAAIVITSYGSVENAIEALRSGARDLLRKPFDPDDLVQAVEKAVAARQREQERLRLRARLPILEIGQALMGQGTVESLARRLLDMAVEQIGAEEAALLLLDQEADELWVTAAVPPDRKMAERRVPAGEGLARQALQGQEPLILEAPWPASQDPLWPTFTAGPGTAVVCVPLRTGQKAIGLLTLSRVERAGRAPFSLSTLNLLSIVSSQIATALENARLVEALRRELAERRRAEEALRESEERYRSLFENMAQGAFHRRADGVLVDANPTALEMFGLTRGQFLGRTSMDPRWKMICEDGSDFPGEQLPSMKALRTGKPVRGVVAGVFTPYRKDCVWLSINAIPQFRAEEDKPYQVFVTLHDITERKQAEEGQRLALAEALQATHALRQSEERYRSLFEGAEDHIFVLDEDLRYVMVNPSALKAGGFALEDVLGKGPQEAFPEDAEFYLSQYRQAFESGEPVRFERELEMPDGAHWYSVTLSPIKDDQGNVIALTGISRDITKRKQAEKERQTHLWFLESLDQVNRAIQGTTNLEQMMSDVLDAVLAIFDCDRASLVYPCDPEAATWQAPMERTKPEWPGALILGLEVPMDPEVARVFKVSRITDAPVVFGPGSREPLPTEIALQFSIQSQITLALYPRIDKPWNFVIHQCSHPRIWTQEERQLFKEIGRRLTDGLTSLLMFRSLRESEGKLTEAECIAHIGYWERDINADRITCSDEAYRIFGLRPQERILSLAQLAELLHPEDRQIMVQAVAEALRGGPRYDVEYRVIRPNGEVRIVHSQGDVRRDKSGQPRSMFGVMQDITERKQAEEALAVREREYRTLVERIPDFVVRYDTDLHRIYVNPAWEVASGLSAKEVINVPAADVPGVPHPIVGEYVEKLREVLETASPQAIEFTWVNANGVTLFLEYAIVPEYDQHGKVAGLLCVGHDLTERKQAESQREAALEALRESEERFRQIAETIREVFYVYDPKLDKFLYVSPTYEAIWQELVQQVYDDPLSFTYAVHPEDKDGFLEAIRREREEGRYFNMEFRIVRPDGTMRWVWSRNYPILDEAGVEHRVVGIAEDITERKQAEQALREAELRYRTVADFTYDWEYWEGPDRTLRYVSPACERITGYAADRFLEDPHFLHEIVVPEDRETWERHRHQAMEGGAQNEIHFRIRRQDGETRWIEHACQAVEDEHGAFLGFRASNRDITKRKRAEFQRETALEALQRSLEQTTRGERLLLALSQAARAVQRAHTLDEVHQAIGEGLTALGLQATILALTSDRTHLALASTTFPPARLKKAARLTGLSPAGYRFPLQPGSIHERCVVHRETIYTEGVIEHLAEALPDPLRPLAARLIPLLGTEKGIVAPLVLGDETLGILSVAGADLSESDVPAITAFASQASIALENARLFEELHAAQQRLATMSRRLVEVQEAERRHLARELHDQVSQTLTGLKLVLQMGNQQRDEGGRQARLETAQGLIDDLAVLVEDLSLNLRPSMLDDLGLLPTLLWHFERYTTQTGVQVRLQHTGVEGRRFAPELETAAYRLVQEALTNVARHADASEVLVRLWAHQDAVGVQIEDAGRGFDPASILTASHATGLNSMRERVALLDGELTIESAPGAGTRLTAELPLAAWT